MTQGEVSIATSNIYPILKGLRQQGLISEHKDEKSRRIMYQLTEKGKLFLSILTESLGTYLRALNPIFEQKKVGEVQ